MTFEVFLNILIIALLTIGIVYAIILEHRLSGAKENRRDLALLIDQFYKASQKTSEELIQLKTLEEQARATLKTDLERAALIRDELNFLLNKVKKTLPSFTSHASPYSLPDSENSKELDTSPTPSTSLSRAEQELIDALNALK